jgi:hypothetical protein
MASRVGRGIALPIVGRGIALPFLERGIRRG